MMFEFADCEDPGNSAVKLFSKYSNVCDHRSFTLQTGRQTDRQTDRRRDDLTLQVKNERALLNNRNTTKVADQITLHYITYRLQSW